jgi:tetratricopeptide (TPR) repeat protein
MFARRAAGIVIVLALSACTGKPAVAPAPAPGAPKFPDFVFPSAQAGSEMSERQAAAWQTLQAGDPRGAEREFAALLKQAPDFYPAEAGLGYAAFARHDNGQAVAHFDKALATNAAYAPALAGKGDALLALGRTDAALEAFQAALAADPGLTSLRERVDVLKFRVAQDNIANARKAADAGRFDEARRRYQTAITASPESEFLYRELASVEHRAGDDTSALTHAQRAAQMDPSDVRVLTLIAQIYEGQKAWTQAADAYEAVSAVDPSDATAAKIDAMRENAAFEAMPDEYKHIDEAATVTRAQLAALLAVHLKALLQPARGQAGLVIVDSRGNWAAQWILEVVRAGVMDTFPNHTFQPSAIVRRADLAEAATRTLLLVGQRKPKLVTQWRDARPMIADVAPSNLSYQAVAMAVSSGVMTLENGAFQPTRPVTGPEALDTVSKLTALAKK